MPNTSAKPNNNAAACKLEKNKKKHPKTLMVDLAMLILKCEFVFDSFNCIFFFLKIHKKLVN